MQVFSLPNAVSQDFDLLLCTSSETKLHCFSSWWHCSCSSVKVEYAESWQLAPPAAWVNILCSCSANLSLTIRSCFTLCSSDFTSKCSPRRLCSLGVIWLLLHEEEMSLAKQNLASSSATFTPLNLAFIFWHFVLTAARLWHWMSLSPPCSKKAVRLWHSINLSPPCCKETVTAAICRNHVARVSTVPYHPLVGAAIQAIDDISPVDAAGAWSTPEPAACGTALAVLWSLGSVPIFQIDFSLSSSTAAYWKM